MKPFVLALFIFLILSDKIVFSKTNKLVKGLIVYPGRYSSYYYYFPGHFDNLDDFLKSPPIGYHISNWELLYELFDKSFDQTLASYIDYRQEANNQYVEDTISVKLKHLPVSSSFVLVSNIDGKIKSVTKTETDKMLIRILLKNTAYEIPVDIRSDIQITDLISCSKTHENRLKNMSKKMRRKMWTTDIHSR